MHTSAFGKCAALCISSGVPLQSHSVMCSGCFNYNYSRCVKYIKLILCYLFSCNVAEYLLKTHFVHAEKSHDLLLLTTSSSKCVHMHIFCFNYNYSRYVKYIKLILCYLFSCNVAEYLLKTHFVRAEKSHDLLLLLTSSSKCMHLHNSCFNYNYSRYVKYIKLILCHLFSCNVAEYLLKTHFVCAEKSHDLQYYLVRSAIPKIIVLFSVADLKVRKAAADTLSNLSGQGNILSF